MMKRLFNNNSGFIQTTISILGNFLATGLSAVAIILLSRILGPEKFGVFSVGFSIVLILTRINEIGLNTAIVKFASAASTNNEKNTIYSIALKYKLIISSIIFTIGIVGAESIAKFINFPDVLVIRFALTAGLVTVYYEQLLFTLQSLHRFTETVIINTIQAGSKLLGASILFIIGIKEVPILFLAYIISPAIPLFFKNRLLPKWHSINLQVENKNVQTKLFKLAQHSSVALISAGIIENIDVLFLQKHLSTYETGLYGGVSRIAMMFALVAYSLGNVLNARVAKYKDKENLSIYIKKALVISGLSFIGFLSFLPFSKLLITITIGEQYLSGLPILIILTGASFFAIAAIPLIALFYSFNTNWYFSVSGLLQLAIVLTGNIFFVPKYGLYAAAFTRLATRGFLFIFVFILGISIYYRKYVKTTK